MVESFRSRMGDLREEIERIASQAEELDRVVQEQQVRLEELDLLVRQRDEQLAERQARVEELEAALREREEELAALRAQLTERERLLAEQDGELQSLRARLAERESVEAALRAQLAQVSAAVPTVAEVPIQTFLERFAVLENLVNRQGEAIASLRTLIQEEMARLHDRIEQLEARLAAAPAVTPPPPAAAVPVAAPAPTPAVEVPLPPVAVAPPPPAVIEGDTLQGILQDTLEMLPAAALVGLAGRDGLSVETLVRRDVALAQPLEVELAELAGEAARVATALGSGPLLTVAFQAGDDHLLLSPVGDDHFAYLLTPTDSPSDFQRAQAILLQAVSRINDLF